MYNLLLIFILTLFNSPRALNEKGNKLYNSGKYEEALQEYKKSQVKDPKLKIVDYNIGCGQYKTSEYNEALKSFTRIMASLEKDEIKNKATYNLGNVLFKAGNLEGSIEMYKQVLRSNPDDIDAKINLEFVQKKMEEMEKEGQDNRDSNGEQKEEGSQSQEEQNTGQEDQESIFSPEATRSLLEALKQDERDIKEKSLEQSYQEKTGVINDW